MKKDPKSLKVHPEIADFPMLTGEQYEALKQSIAADGRILKPLVVTPDGLVIDGRNRLRAALELGLAEVPVEVRTDENPVLYALETAAVGRQLSKTAIVLLLLEHHPELADDRTGRKKKCLKTGHFPRGDKLATDSYRLFADRYQVPRDYFRFVVICLESCRNRFDLSRLRIMVYEMEVSATNLEKSLLGWQACHPVEEDVSEDDLKNEPPPKRKDPNPAAIMFRSFTSIRESAVAWTNIPPEKRTLLRDDFMKMWKSLPDELKKAVRA